MASMAGRKDTIKRRWVLLALSAAMLLAACEARKKYEEDGVFEGSSSSIYHRESFCGLVKLEIKNHRITKVDFQIVDKERDEVFNLEYGDKHYAGNGEYLLQTKNDWRGVQTYPGKLLETQDIAKVDAVAGATWSYNIFKDSVGEALSAARIQRIMREQEERIRKRSKEVSEAS